MRINEIATIGIYAPSSLASAEAFAEMNFIKDDLFSVNKEGIVTYSNSNPTKKEKVALTFLGGDSVHFVMYARDSGYFTGSGNDNYDGAMRRFSMFGLNYLVS